jgi:hypothetical protein
MIILLLLSLSSLMRQFKAIFLFVRLFGNHQYFFSTFLSDCLTIGILLGYPSDLFTISTVECFLNIIVQYCNIFSFFY